VRQVEAVAFAADGGTVALGYRSAFGAGDSVIELRDAGTGKLLRTLQGHGGGVSDLAFGRDGKILASAGHDGTLRLWDVATGHERTDFHGHLDPVRTLAYSPDPQLLPTARSH